MTFRHRIIIVFTLCVVATGPASFALAGTLVVRAPAAVSSASATTDGAAEIAGKPDNATVTFTNVPENTPLTIQLKLADGTTLQGVHLNWHSDEPARPEAGELTDDDREQIRAIVQDVRSFYNKSDILLLSGDHDRAVALVQLVRDSDFHAGRGQVVWRVELYSFKFQYGGWEKVQQQNRIVRRERFSTIEEYKAATERLRWVKELAGIVVGAKETKTVELKE
jgi:hypothetical protein